MPGLPEINPLVKNVVAIPQNCSETQISFSHAQPSILESPKNLAIIRHLFSDRPGSLGNCWLVASFAAVAEFPCFIQNHVFATNQSSSSGYTGFGLWQPLKDTGDASSVKLGNHLQEIQENNFKSVKMSHEILSLFVFPIVFVRKTTKLFVVFFAAKHATDHLMTWMLFFHLSQSTVQDLSRRQVSTSPF